MRSSTVMLAEAALRLGGVREAARACAQPPSRCSAALSALEAGLGVALARRNPDGLALTHEGRRSLPALGRIAANLRRLHDCAAPGAPARPAGLEALFRAAEILDQGSIRRAARRLGVGQPQLSRQFALVEAALGATLAERAGSGIRPTEAGRRAQDAIALIAADWRSLLDAGASQPLRPRRRVSIGAVIPATPDGDLANVLGEIVRRLALGRGQNLTVVSTLAEDLLTGLDSGRFDCAFLDTRVRDRCYGQIEVARGRVALCGAPPTPGDPLDRETLLALLAVRPLVLQSRRSGLRRRAEAFLEARVGPDWRGAATVLEIDSLPILVNVVAKDGFLSVLPQHVADAVFPGRQATLPESYDQRLYLTWRSGARSKAVAEMVAAELAPSERRDDWRALP